VWPALEIVAEAKNGAEAVALTEKHRPDIVFLDIRMPGMTGIEAARAIAQLPVDDDDAETSASGDGRPGTGPRSSSSPPTTSTRSRPSSRASSTMSSSLPSAIACR
jgi:CheY-like chemotaxis protein